MIGRFLGRRVSEGRMPGAAWTVSRDGQLVDRGVVGAAQLRPSVIPLDLMTPFDLASLTKPLCTAILLMIASHRRELRLGAPAVEWLPEWSGTPYASVTLRDLAFHRSGLRAWFPLSALPGIDVGAAVTPADAMGRAQRFEQVLLGLGKLEPVAATGTTLYSDLGYVALGAVLERALGQGLDELFQQRIAAPVGLRYTGFPNAKRSFENAAAVEEGNAFERKLAGSLASRAVFRESISAGQVHDGNAFLLHGVAGHAGLFGTIGDVVRLGTALLSAKSPLDCTDGELEQLMLPGSAGGPRTFGFECARSNRAVRGIFPPDAPGHLGFTGTSIWLLPSIRAVAVLLTHRVHPQVTGRDFQWVRRGFHRLALRRLESAGGVRARGLHPS